MPPAISGQPPMGASPVAMKLAGAGQGAGGIALVRSAIDQLEQALTQLPLGSDVHKAVAESITKLAKVAPAAEASPGVGQSALRSLLQRMSQGSMNNAFLRAAGGPGAMAPGGQPGAETAAMGA